MSYQIKRTTRGEDQKEDKRWGSRGPQEMGIERTTRDRIKRTQKMELKRTTGDERTIADEEQ